MKKVVFVLFAGLLVFTGCEKSDKNTLECSKTEDDLGTEYKSIVTAKLKDNKISEITGAMELDDEKLANSVCELFSKMSDEDSEINIKVKCDGKTVTITNFDELLASDDDVQIIGLEKDKFVELMKTEEYKCK